MTVVKASQAISGQIELDQLLETIMSAAIECAGAQTGHLLLVEKTGVRLVAHASVDVRKIHVQIFPAEAPFESRLPVSILNYVRRSHDRVLLDDAAVGNPFFADPYFADGGAKSVLCLPFLRRGRAAGLLYLENRLASHVFTSNRIAVLDLLAGQAAISIENARLYADLRKENDERRRAEEALRESRQLLEQRVNDRTRDLQIAADVSRQITTVLQIDRLLQQIVALTVKGFKLYAAMFFMLDDEERMLIRTAAADAVCNVLDKGGFEQIPLTAEPSIIALAARTREAVCIDDVTISPMHLFSAVVPESRSELAIPIKLGGRLLGVFDLQSTQPGRFRDEDIRILTSLAGQIAVAVRNARLFAEAHAAQVAAEAANRAKTAFLDNMSHELRTPLNAILGFSRLLGKKSSLPREVRDDIGIIRRGGEHLHALINQVLELSRIEAGSATLEETGFDLEKLLQDLHAMFVMTARERGLDLLFERAGDLPRQVRADQVKLRQVLINLLHNALKFTSRGSVTLRIDRLPAPDAAAACRLAFTVIDTGPGIPPEERAGLFQAFVQADAGRRTRQGTGLGLAISRDFVRLMGGELRLDSEAGCGTIVSFDIKAHLLDAIRTEGFEVLPVRRLVLAEGQRGYRVLVVDDRWSGRQLLLQIMTPFNFELREAANGEQAVAAWEDWRPHFIWMDMRMPVMDGFEATRRIKAADKDAATRIVAITASNSEDEKTAIRAAGCDDFLRKPFEDVEMLDMLRKHLGVEFTDADDAPASAEPKALTTDALAAIPHALKAGLSQAVVQLDMEAIEHMIAEIGRIDRDIAQALNGLAGEFQYARISQWLRAGEKESNP